MKIICRQHDFNIYFEIIHCRPTAVFYVVPINNIKRQIINQSLILTQICGMLIKFYNVKMFFVKHLQHYFISNPKNEHTFTFIYKSTWFHGQKKLLKN